MSRIEVQAISHFAITVTDLDRSLAFYRDLLGLEVASDRVVQGDHISRGVQVPGAQIRIALLQSLNVKLELLQYLAPSGKPFDRANNDVGACHVAFQVSNLDQTYARLLSAGVSCSAEPYPSSYPPGTGWFYARDPDGITVEFGGPLAEIPQNG